MTEYFWHDWNSLASLILNCCFVYHVEIEKNHIYSLLAELISEVIQD